MNDNQLKNIISELSFTDIQSPYFKGKLFGILWVIVVKRKVYTFQYAETFVCHYLYIRYFENHNTMYHDGGTKHQVGL